MAKRKVVTTTPGPIIQPAYREQLLERLKKIDGKVVLEVSRAGTKAGHFSDWHDRFRDNGSFTDAWGKAGDIRAKGKAQPAVMPRATRVRRGR